jgi:hypothetical protein
MNSRANRDYANLATAAHSGLLPRPAPTSGGLPTFIGVTYRRPG